MWAQGSPEIAPPDEELGSESLRRTGALGLPFLCVWGTAGRSKILQAKNRVFLLPLFGFGIWAGVKNPNL